MADSHTVVSFDACLQQAVLAATGSVSVSAATAVAATRLLPDAIEACAAASARCVREAFEQGSDVNGHGIGAAMVRPSIVRTSAAVQAVLANCGLGLPAGGVSATSVLVPQEAASTVLGGSLLSVVAPRLWAVLRWYHAVQLVVMPWVCVWLFSGAVIGFVRFVKFQYQLVRIGIDAVLLMVLFVLLTIEDFVIESMSACCACVRQSSRERRRLERCVRTAATYSAWCKAEAELKEFQSQECSFCCSRTHRRPSAAAGTEEEHLASLHRVLDRIAAAPCAVGGDLATLQPLMVRQAAGMDLARLPHSDGYFEKLSDSLAAVCGAQLGGSPAARDELLAWLLARQKALGVTALCLSGGGSLAMHHMGVCRFLIEESLLPSVVSGVSGGSIVAAFLAIHTNEELLNHVFVPDIVVRHKPNRWFPPWWKEIINFMRFGVLVTTEEFEETTKAFYGTWTFEEAYSRTGREVNIVISSNFSRRLPACVMLNHMTAPHVVIASAVATSCAALGVMKPRGLVTKDPATGDLKPFDLLGKSFTDGSFTAEVPKNYLRSFFGATQFIVSQVNPHVSPFLGMQNGALQTLRSSLGRDLQARANLLSDSHLLPAFFGSAMCKTTSHLAQNFEESREGVTVFPAMGVGSVKAAVTNPSVRDMEHYILEGQRMTWGKAIEIQKRMHTENALKRAVDSLRAGASDTDGTLTSAGGSARVAPTWDQPPILLAGASVCHTDVAKPCHQRELNGAVVDDADASDSS